MNFTSHKKIRKSTGYTIIKLKVILRHIDVFTCLHLPTDLPNSATVSAGIKSYNTNRELNNLAPPENLIWIC
jgi:hypothetical protein